MRLVLCRWLLHFAGGVCVCGVTRGIRLLPKGSSQSLCAATAVCLRMRHCVSLCYINCCCLARQVHMHRTQCLLFLLFSLFLQSTRSCSETQYEYNHRVDVNMYLNCAKTTSTTVTLFRNAALEDGRFSWTNEHAWPRHLFSLSQGGDRSWILGGALGTSQEVLVWFIEDVEMPPVNAQWTKFTCDPENEMQQVTITHLPPDCNECGQNKITPPGSNTCQCRAGQTPGPGGACTGCLSNTYKPEPSDAACTLCPAGTSSAVGSSVVTECACNPGFSGKDGGECTACAIGKHGVVV